MEILFLCISLPDRNSPSERCVQNSALAAPCPFPPPCPYTPRMLVFNDWKSFPSHFRGGVLCVGNFDGVHRGHAQMLSTGHAEAKRRGIPFTIMTFDPHPILLLRPN